MIPNPTYGSWERAIIGAATGSFAAPMIARSQEP